MRMSGHDVLTCASPTYLWTRLLVVQSRERHDDSLEELLTPPNGRHVRHCAVAPSGSRVSIAWQSRVPQHIEQYVNTGIPKASVRGRIRIETLEGYACPK